MRAKVCILTTVHPPFDTRIFHKEAKTLARAGYDVALIAQHDGNTVVEGVRVIGLPRVRNRLSRIFGLTWRAFRLALRQRADLYHFHDPELLPIGVLLKLLTKAKVIYDAHEDYPQHMLSKEWLPRPLRGLASKLIWEVEKFSGRYLDAVVTPTDSITKRFQQLKVRRALTLYNFPSISSLTEDFTPFHKASSYDLIHVGTLSAPRLGFILSIALELRKTGREVKWCILGASSQLIEWAKARLTELNLVDNFTIIGWVPHAEVERYLCQSRIGINHHLAEPRFLVAIPVKVFEYMAYGIPVVSSDLPLLRKFLGDEKCILLVKPGDVREFANAVKYLLDNPDVAEKMGAAGRKLAKEKYNWQTEGEKLLQLYDKLL